jgi:hypothetical protein
LGCAGGRRSILSSSWVAIDTLVIRHGLFDSDGEEAENNESQTMKKKQCD